jgi:type IV secretion system protein TrbL
MNFFKHVIIFGLLSSVAGLSYAAAPAVGADSVLDLLQSAMNPAVKKLTAQAITWLAAFSTLQFVITNYGLLKTADGDIQSLIAKTAFNLAWIGICLYIINNGPQFITAVGHQMFGLVGLEMPSPSGIMANTMGIVASLAGAAVVVGGVGFLGSTTAGLLLVYCLLLILAVGMFFAFKIFMLQLELALVVMLSPLSFSFLGMSALREQGIAPFKALISLAYRIILLTVILSAFSAVNGAVADAVTTVTSSFTIERITSGIGDAAKVLLSAVGAYMMLAYLVYKSDAIAASLSSGSTSMGTADLASAAAAGAAAGAAIATGGAAGAGAIGQAPQSMSNFIQGLSGGGSVSNASGSGTGGTDSAMLSSPNPPSMSVPSSSTGSSGFDGSTRGLSPEASAQIAPVNRGYGATNLETPQPASPPSGRIDTTGNISAAKAARDSGPSSPPQSSEPPAPATPSSGGESKNNAGIGGSLPNNLEKTLDKLADHMANQSEPRQKTLGERLSDVNQHVAQEGAGTHVSINTHSQE